MPTADAAAPAHNHHHAHQATKETGRLEAFSDGVFAIALTLELVQSTDSPMVSEFLEVFSIAPPEPKLDNFNRSSISKKCDFFFGRLHHQRGTRPNQNGMFVEAKLVSPKHPMGYYVSTGLQRFLNGDYAWAMPQAINAAAATPREMEGKWDTNDS